MLSKFNNALFVELKLGRMDKQKVIRCLKSKGFDLRENVVVEGESGVKHSFDFEVANKHRRALVDVLLEVDELKLFEFCVKLYDVNREGIIVAEEVKEEVIKLAKEAGIEIIIP